MTTVHAFESPASIEVPNNDLIELRSAVDSVVNNITTLSALGMHEINIPVVDLAPAHPDESKLISVVQDELMGTAWEGRLESVWLSWIDDADLYKTYLRNLRNTPLGNLHCDYMRVIRNNRLELVHQPIGRLSTILYGDPTEEIVGNVQVDDDDLNVLLSGISTEDSIQSVARISRLPGVVIGVDDVFLRGFTDSRRLDGDYTWSNGSSEQWYYRHPNSIHKIATNLRTGRTLVIAEIKYSN